MWKKLGPEQPSAGRKVCTSWGRAACHQGLTYLTVLGIFHLSSPLHLSRPCSVSQGGWPVRTVSLGFPVLWCPLGFSQWGALAGDQREGKCEFPVLPIDLLQAGCLPTNDSCGSCHMALSQQLFSLSSSNCFPALPLHAGQGMTKGARYCQPSDTAPSFIGFPNICWHHWEQSLY